MVTSEKQINACISKQVLQEATGQMDYNAKLQKILIINSLITLTFPLTIKRKWWTWVSFLKEYLRVYSMKRLLFHGSKITEGNALWAHV